jgi:hypothetical protein
MGALEKMVVIGFGLITTALSAKAVSVPGWEQGAIVGGFVLFIVLTFLSAKSFELNFWSSLLVSAFFTGLIMFFIYAPFVWWMIAIAVIIFVIAFIAAYLDSRS